MTEQPPLVQPTTSTADDDLLARANANVTMSNLGDYQLGIYTKGVFGHEKPPVTTDLVALEDHAAAELTAEALGYIRPAAGAGTTAAANREAFAGWNIVPRMLNGTAHRDHRTVVLGTEHCAPLIMAPVGVQTLAHPDGELASARAAAAVDVTYVHSTQAAHTFEEVAEANGTGSRWYQLYWPSDRDVCESFLDRAEASGYTTLMLTLDTVVLAWRPHDLDRGYLPFLKGVGIANYLSDPAFRASLDRTPDDDPVGAILKFSEIYSNPGLSWDDIAFLRERWQGPIALKGIQSPRDARLAVDHGIDGIVVSNHGGRQVDGAIASLDALEPIADEVADEIAILFDSGIRTGADMVKALALGADAVMVGRQFLYGLAMNGQQGVEHVLRSLLAEFDLTTVLSGHHSHHELGRESLVRALRRF